MLLQAIVAIAWLVWLCSGTAGLKQGFTLGALLVVGFAVKRFLDVHWKPKVKGEEKRHREVNELPSFSFSSRSQRGSLPSPNWSLSPYGMDQNTPNPGRLGRR